MKARSFFFGDDFRSPPPEESAARDASRDEAREEAERQAYRRGLADGRSEAEAETGRRIAETAERLAEAIPAVSLALDRVIAEMEGDALAFFGAVARKLAGRAVAEQPLAAVGEAAAVAFRHLRGVPHMAARVAPDLVDGTDELLRRLGREHGFEGRIVVLGDDAAAPGDARIEWADGGVVLDQLRLDDAVAGLLNRAAGLQDGMRL